MKRFACAATAALGLAITATPADAALFSWDIDYTGWWELDGGGSLMGELRADETAADDGILSASELVSWSWDWSGNDFVSAFSISSEDVGAEIQEFLGPDTVGFYVDGTPNLPDDGLDQGVFVGGDEGQYVLDLEFLFIEDNTFSFPFGGDLTAGDTFAPEGDVAVGEPKKVPEPATVMGLIALAAAGVTVKRQTQAA
ncbi:MAG: PEP-CTERM sorting domain-containing protein [Leptolyngbyaceae cyanobacterium]